MSRTLEDIIAHGNRGLIPYRWVDNNTIVCQDGYVLSVIAGEGAYCLPRPGVGGTPRDYTGPYTHVEVMVGSDEDRVITMSADEVRALVASHGGAS